jgi:streptogramin lyase
VRFFKKIFKMSAFAFVCAIVLQETTVAQTQAASDATIRGIVTDSDGKPIRGALVKATAEGKSTSRYTAADGHYELTVAPGPYRLSAEAYGFAAKRQAMDSIETGATNFSLTASWNVTRLSGADIDQLIPDTPKTNLVKTSCQLCHSLDLLLGRRGHTAEQWKAYLETPQMLQRMGKDMRMSPLRWDVLTKELERLFGPDAEYFGPDAEPPARELAKHPDMAPEVAKATFHEYRVPDWTWTMTHSLKVDANGEVWLAGYDPKTNAVIRFNPTTEQFKLYPIPTPGMHPHTPCVSSDGRVWMALDEPGEVKAVVVDPKTDQLVELKWPEKRPGTHNCAEDADGNMWFSSLGDPNEGFYRYDVKNDEWRAFPFKLPASYPPGSRKLRGLAEGEPVPAVTAGIYGLQIDSQGGVWGSVFNFGMLVRVDPKTGATKEYYPPDTPEIRGFIVDSKDNLWFGNYDNHKLGMLDPKTGQFTFYQPPTPKSTPYGFVEDRRRGYIWFGDHNGNNVTRFDPKTLRFVEYPCPSRNVNSRLGIGIDPQGRIWYTQWILGGFGVLDPGE